MATVTEVDNRTVAAIPLKCDDRPDARYYHAMTPPDEEEPSIIHKMLIGPVLSALSFDHHIKRGHTEKVNQVSTSTDLRFIASASEDRTARIWSRNMTKVYDDVLYECRLHAVLEHFSAVSSVTFLDNAPQNIILTGTASGDVFLWNLPTEHDMAASSAQRLRVSRSPGDEADVSHRVNSLAAACVGENTWHVLAACSDRHLHFMTVDRKGGRSWALHYATGASHDTIGADLGPVLDVCHITPTSAKGAAFASCVSSGVYLWTSDCQPLAFLEAPVTSTGRHVKFNAVASVSLTSLRHLYSEDCGADSFIAAGGDDNISIWAMHEGELVDAAGEKINFTKGRCQPLLEYNGRKLERIAVGSQGDVCFVREDGACVMLCLRHETEEQQRAHPSGLGRHFVQDRDETIVHVIRHQSFVTALYMLAFNTGTGKVEDVLVTGCEDGQVFVWDNSGEDAGECLATLRSLKVGEIFGFMFEKIVVFIQMACFAFEDSMHWKPEVAKGAAHMRCVFLVNPSAFVRANKSFLLKHEVQIVLVVMLLFVLITLLGCYELLNRANAWLQSTKMFMNETKWKRENNIQRNYCLGLAHSVLHFNRELRKCLLAFMKVTATLLVVPAAKAVATACHCSDKCADEVVLEGANCLVLDPTVQCYVGWHRVMMYTIVPLASVFFFLLLPFAVVGGDATYVQRSELCQPESWRENAVRKIGCVHMGPFQKNASQSFAIDLSEVLLKVLVPVIVIFTIHMPVVMASMVSTLFLINLVINVVWDPLQDNRGSMAIRGMKLLLLCLMLCGLFSAVTDDPSRHEPTICLLASVLLIPSATLYKISREGNKEVRELRLSEREAVINRIGAGTPRGFGHCNRLCGLPV